jgi:hypothetical protein
LLIALAVGLTVGIIAHVHAGTQPLGGMSDFDQVWVASSALRSGADPYAAVAATRWPFPLYYPITTATLTLPLTFISLASARVLFFAVSSALFAYVLAVRPHRLLALLSGSFFLALLLVQWSPLMTGAASLSPVLAGAVWSAKPNIGLAIAVGTLRTWRAWFLTALGGGLLTAMSLLVLPGWPASFLNAAHHAPHVVAPITILPLGPIVLVALMRWRDADARLLVALACIPQTVALYGTLPLFLIPRTRRESMVIVLLSDVAFIITMWLLPAIRQSRATTLAASTPLVGTILIAFLYLPCVIMVLRRPNLVHAAIEPPLPLHFTDSAK